jgi:hypothetical protein
LKVDPGPHAEPERGVISYFNDYFVFVQFKGAMRAQGTRREDLTWEFPLKHEL